MIINRISIKKFRGFSDVGFELGKFLTVIAGQNGTQKTTLLGMLSQPFSIADPQNVMYGEKPLCGGSFKSAFAEKFKLSEDFDKPKEHEWTLCLDGKEDFTVESIKRTKTTVRFWQKGKRSKGEGYIQMPVIYLSLSRLLPIGEDYAINSSNEVKLSDEEFRFYKTWHDKILIIPDENMVKADYLKSKHKNTLGANTLFYDWKMNSAGQDNIGKIILAILSFKRLKEKHPDNYRGGILAIDELDTTLYPASQIKLIQALRNFASEYKIQIIFTTHSLSILEHTCELQRDTKCLGQTKVVYLEKSDHSVKVVESLEFHSIMHKLKVTLAEPEKAAKIPVFTEDKEGSVFLKAILKSKKASRLAFLDCTLGCCNLIELSQKKIPGLRFPDSLIVLDGDVKSDKSQMKKIARLKNVLLLPGKISPERLLAEYLHNLSDDSIVWKNILPDYTKQHCFKEYTLGDIMENREKAKAWFNSQSKHWGRNCAKIINPWIDSNKSEVVKFLEAFQDIYDNFSKALL